MNSLAANKGSALRMLADELGIPVEQTMAFGDDLNDIAMLKEAGIGVAMGNAPEEVRRAADFVTDDCDHSGVASAMHRFLGKDTL